jgi:hypothetical protein
MLCSISSVSRSLRLCTRYVPAAVATTMMTSGNSDRRSSATTADA